MMTPITGDNMGEIKLSLTGPTLKQVNALAEEFEKTRNLGGILRIIALKALAVGDSIEKISDTLRTSGQTIRNWRSEFLQRGVKSLFQKAPQGRPRSLTPQEEKILVKTLENPPSLAGFTGGSWNAKKVRQLILDKFKKKLSKKYIPELLRRLGLSFKKAKIQVRGRNEVLRDQWLELVWPKIVETAELQGGHILFGDSAHFSIFGTAGYSWAPRNAECIVESTGSKKGLHVIGAINYGNSNTHAMILEEMVDADAFICFLKLVLSETRKPIHLIIDNAGYHKSKTVREFQKSNSARLTLHYLPPYSPDYNPIEGLWKKIKAETTHNVYFESVEALKSALIEQLKRFRLHREEIQKLFGFYEQEAA
jgi:transposase